MTDPQSSASAGLSLRRGQFSRFFWAAVIGSTGDWITIFATLTIAKGYGGEAGIVFAILARVLPGLLIGPVVGALTDRMDRRRLIVIADWGRGLLVPLLAISPNLRTILFVTFFMEILSLAGQSPRAAVLPRLVKKSNIVAANSLMMGAAYGTIPLGAAFNWVLAGFPSMSLGGLVPEVNQVVALAFIFDALTFFVAGAIIASFPAIRAKPANVENASDSSTFADIREGLRFIWRDRSVLRVIVGMTAALFGGGFVIVVGQTFVETSLEAGDSGFFAVVTLLGVGAGFGFYIVSLFERLLAQREAVFTVAVVVTGVGLGAAAFTQTVAGAGAWMLVMGFGAGAAYVMGLTHLHEEVEDELRGRVFATLFLLIRLGLFVSMSIAPVLLKSLRTAQVPWLFEDAARSVLLLGAILIGLTGATGLRVVRSQLHWPQFDTNTRATLAEVRRVFHQRGIERPPVVDDHDDDDDRDHEPT